MTSNLKWHELIPFEKAQSPFKISTAVSFHDRLFEARFQILNDEGRIFFPPVTKSPQRQDNLWKTTCFEVFLNPNQGNAYWEFNFSPSGHWACYHFTNYLVGMKNEERVNSVSCRPDPHSSENKIFRATADLSGVPEIFESKRLNIGLTTIVATHQGEKFHHALLHPGSKPDFHDRQGFALSFEQDKG